MIQISDLDDLLDLTHLGLPKTIPVAPVRAGDTEEWDSLRSHETTKIGPGAAGCFLAHRNIWNMSWSASASIKSEPIALVLERDARLTTYGHRWLLRLVQAFRMSGVDILNLGSFGPDALWFNAHNVSSVVSSWINVARYQGRKALGPVLLPTFGHRTHAYLIKRSYAERLARIPLDFQLPVDSWLLRESQSISTVGRHVAPRLFATHPMVSEVEARGR